MNNRMLLINVFLQLSIMLNMSGSMGKQLQEKGFVEVNNTDMTKNDYNKLYSNFDDFINLIDSNPIFAAQLYSSEKEFLLNEIQKKRYCGAPPSYRDPKIHTTKRFNKIYFQYIKEHHDQLKSQPYLLETAKNFLDGMNKLDFVSKIHFNKILDQLEHDNTGIKKLLDGNNSDLTVISKIVRYKKDDAFKWGTTPHFDKSALTLVWDSNDDDHDSLILCEDPNNPSIDKLHKPERIYAHQENASSALLITGSAAQKAGWNQNQPSMALLHLTKIIDMLLLVFS